MKWHLAAPVAALFLGGCVTTVKIAVRGPAVQVTSPVGRYIALRERDPFIPQGAVNVVYFVTRTNLQSVVSNRQFDHVYYRLHACSRIRSEGELFAWPVFPVSAEASEQVAVENGMNLYKAFLPTDIEAIRARARTMALDFDIEQEIAAARASGLCLTLGAGNMGGGSLTSDPVDVPVHMTSDEIIPVDHPRSREEPHRR